jgi:hypothetical protein
MNTIDFIQQTSFINICSIAVVPVLYPMTSQLIQSPDRAIAALVGLYLVLVLILKHRAAYYRKARKWKNFDGGIGKYGIVLACLREFFTSEAKVSPSNPFFSSIWNVLCYAVVWGLFPQRIVDLYVPVAWVYHIVHLSVAGLFVDNLANENNLYYPTFDLHALIPLDSK